MSELGPVGKLMVESARDGLGPDDAAIARVRARVAAAVSGAVVVGAATSASAASAAATGAKVGSGIAYGKLVALVVVAGLAVGGAVAVVKLGDGPAPAAPAVEPARVASAPSTSPPVPTTAPSDAPSIPIPPPAPRAIAESHPTKHVAAAAAPEPAQPPVVDEAPAAPPPATLAREVAMIDDATAALREGRARDAISTIAAFDRETEGHGQLAEDAAALELEALCALHAPTAAAKLAAFDHRWPHSAERARIAAACADR